MGEEAVKQEEAKVEEKKEEKTEEKKEEKTEDKKEEKTEEKKEEPSSPVVLFVDLHCVGCAKKIERSIMKFRGVEDVEINMAQNQITIKGIVEPQAICMRIQKKTKRRAKILSPLPPAEGEPIPQVVASQVSGPTTIELNINMHCEACAQQLRRKILKMKGVQTAETEQSSGKVTVTGTMDANRLVEYVYRRTKKQARIVPQPEPAPAPAPTPEKQEEKKEGDEKAAEESAKPKEKKEENGEKAQEEVKKDDSNQSNESNGKEEKVGESNEEPKKEGEGEGEGNNIHYNEEIMKKMMYYHPPFYVIERIPPPQLFSDENPNACCIS